MSIWMIPSLPGKAQAIAELGDSILKPEERKQKELIL